MSRTSIELEPLSAGPLPKPTAIHLTKANNTLPASSSQDALVRDDVEDDLSLRRVATTVETTAQTALVITAITLVTATASLLNGLVTVSLPTLAIDLGLGPDVLLWPSSIQALTCGCTLLLSGSIADAIGARFMYLAGTILQTAFVLGCALSRNALEIIMFRGLSGIAVSFCLPSAVSIITSSFTGKRRNMAFAFMGGGQPAGFVVGLVLGGVLTDKASWRVGFYLSAGLTAITFALILWGLPSSANSADELTWKQRWQQITHDIDWIGAIISSTSLAMFSYVFASITGNLSNIREPSSIALLSIAGALLPAFFYWVGRQERLGRPAIMPNSLWRNKIFTTICVAVFFTWGAFNAFETMLTFYFQDVQKLSATQTSLRFLPAPAAGIAVNILTGYLVHRVSANRIVNVGLAVTCLAPFVMVFATPTSSYWSSGFLACLFNPVGPDTLFTVANLLITSVFPAKTQGLAGGVFNTISQIGKSVGLALVAIIASSVTAESAFTNKSSPDALMTGYKATFWFCFALCASTLVIVLWGLRRIGNVGHKRE